MDKRLFSIVFIINLLLVYGFLGFSQVSGATAIGKIITEHNQSIADGEYEQAYNMFTSKSKELINLQDFEAMRTQVIESSRLAKVFEPALNDDWAAGCFVVYNKIQGKEYPLFNVAILKRENGKWLLVGDTREIPYKMMIKVFPVIVKAQENVEKDKEALIAFGAKERESIEKQLKASLAEIKIYLKVFKKIDQEGFKDIPKDVYGAQPPVDDSVMDGAPF